MVYIKYTLDRFLNSDDVVTAKVLQVNAISEENKCWKKRQQKIRAMPFFFASGEVRKGGPGKQSKRQGIRIMELQC